MGFFTNLLNIICYLPLLGALFIVFGLKREQTKAIKTLATVVAGWTSRCRCRCGSSTSRRASRSSSPTVRVDPVGGLELPRRCGRDLDPPDPAHHLARFISVYSSFTAITHREKEYYVFLLVLQTGMLGVFVSLDFILFYVFWEVMLVPMYFLIGSGAGRASYTPRSSSSSTPWSAPSSCWSASSPLLLQLERARGGWPRGPRNAPTFDVTELFKIAPQVPAGCSSGSSSRSSSGSRSRCRCSRSTPGCRTPTSRLPRRVR